MVWPFTSSTTVQPDVPAPVQSLASELPESPPAASAKQLTRDEVADKELEAFLAELEIGSAKPKYTRGPREDDEKVSKARDISSHDGMTFEDSLLPTIMSCRQIFDNAFYCQSLGGQFNAVYRYGGMRDCAPLWSDFWFCMKVRTWSDEPRAEAIRERYRKRAEVLKSGASSEDVWKSRDKKAEWGDSFNVKYDPPQESDEEWNRREVGKRVASACGAAS